MDYLEHNRAWWDEAVPFHRASGCYKTEEFLSGRNVLDPLVRERMACIRGKRLLHLQCHFGLDTLCLARMGADVTGLDFSANAIAAARELSSEADVAAQFIEGDVLDPPAGLTGFDVVFASWGALGWIKDVQTWMRTAAGALKPGGALFLFEGHPAMTLFDDKAASDAPLVLRYPYDSTEPFVEDVQGTYAAPDAVLSSTRIFYFIHGLSRIFAAAMGAGFAIRKFEEFHLVPWKGLPQLVQRDEYYWAMPEGAPFVPLSFALNCNLERGPNDQRI